MKTWSNGTIKITLRGLEVCVYKLGKLTRNINALSVESAEISFSLYVKQAQKGKL